MFLFITTLSIYINFNTIIKLQDFGVKEEPTCFIWFKDENNTTKMVVEHDSCKQYFLKYGSVLMDFGQYNSDRD